MNQIKLELENYGYLDVTNDVDIPLNLNVNDFRDISTRNGAWSKTISLAGTNTNNRILGLVFDVNINTLTFNPKIKENVKIIIDGFIAFEGIFQLRKVNKKYKSTEDFKIVYDCFIRAETPSFYSDIFGKNLDDLTLLLNGRDGSPYPLIEPTLENILSNMSGGTVLDGYQFYLPYTANINPDYSPQTLIPGIYAKVIWDNIFYNTDYDYEWDELQSLNFDKMIIPYDGGIFEQFNSIDKEFRVGNSNDDFYLLWQADSIPSNVPLGTTAPTSSTPQTLIYDDENNAIENWFDNPSKYFPDGTINVAGMTYGMDINIKFYADVVLELINPSNPALTATDIINDGFYGIRVGLEVGVYDAFENLLGTIYYDPYMYQASSLGMNGVLGNQNFTNQFTNYQVVDSVQFDITCNYVPSLYPNANFIKPVITIFYANNQSFPFVNYHSVSTGDLFDPKIYFNVIPQSDATGHITATVDNTLVAGSNYPIEQLLPKEITQSSFILSIIKMFNLYFYPDPNDVKKLIFKTRDRFYEEGVELDWTSKLDIESVDIELLSNLRKKRTLFTHKQDEKDILLKEYNNYVKEIYGQQEYVLENEFITDIEKIETTFSPTVSLTNHNNQVPYIDNITAMNTKIIYVGDVIDGYWVYYNGYGNLPENYFYNSYYRYAGHFYPNQIEPSEDLNFGVCDFYAHNYDALTNNNLYNRFYRTQMDIFENGYMMTAYFNLSYLDFKDIVMNERIYVYDSWWNINRVIDMNLNGKSLTKVELVTADKNIGDFNPTKLFRSDFNGSEIFTSIINKESTNNRSNRIGNDTTNVIIGGNDNFVQENINNSLILGDRNKLQGNNVYINGTGNLIKANNLNVLGLNNQTFDQDDTTTTNTLIRQTHLIDAGREEVLNPYPTNKIINWIDGGREEVRPVGGFSIESFIDCGRDKVI